MNLPMTDKFGEKEREKAVTQGNYNFPSRKDHPF